jgi:hypothetical protein
MVYSYIVKAMNSKTAKQRKITSAGPHGGSLSGSRISDDPSRYVSVLVRPVVYAWTNSVRKYVLPFPTLDELKPYQLNTDVFFSDLHWMPGKPAVPPVGVSTIPAHHYLTCFAFGCIFVVNSWAFC